MNLKWFQNEWIHTIHHIDYKIDSLVAKNNQTEVVLKYAGSMPMPVDVFVVYKDGSKESYYIPLDLMLGQKNNPFPQIPRKVLKAWRYPVPEYRFTLDRKKDDIQAIVIDPLGFMADIDQENNLKSFEKPQENSDKN